MSIPLHHHLNGKETGVEISYSKSTWNNLVRQLYVYYFFKVKAIFLPCIASMESILSSFLFSFYTFPRGRAIKCLKEERKKRKGYLGKDRSGKGVCILSTPQWSISMPLTQRFE